LLMLEPLTPTLAPFNGVGGVKAGFRGAQRETNFGEIASGDVPCAPPRGEEMASAWPVAAGYDGWRGMG